MKVCLDFEDDNVPRTLYYQKVCEAIKSNPRFEQDKGRADIFIPSEDTAVETNWPRFGDPDSSYIRGTNSEEIVNAYVEKILNSFKSVCIINMHPFKRLPLVAAAKPYICVADINLLSWERSLNPCTISMPALPIITGTETIRARKILASFRGASSHRCRFALQNLHDGKEIICQIVTRGKYVGNIDATSQSSDKEYADLLASSVFAFVPRGEAHFSYRLLEVMSFGCIPVIIADDLILPFDRTIDWSNFSIRISELEIGNIPKVLSQISSDRILQMQHNVRDIYRSKFSSIYHVVDSLLDELEVLLSRPQAVPLAGDVSTIEELLVAYQKNNRQEKHGCLKLIKETINRLLGRN